MKKKQAKKLNPERHLYFNLSSFPSNRCRSRGVQTIPFFYTQVIWFFFLQLEQYFANYSWFCLTIADLAMIMPLITWNLLDFRVAEKEKLLKQYLLAQPWWSRLWSACLAIRRISKVISRKRIGQTVLHRPYLERNTEHFQYFVRDMNSPVAPPEGFFGVK